MVLQLVKNLHIAAVLLAAAFFAPLLNAQQVEQGDRVRRLIAELDGDKYAVRQNAHRQLALFGLPALDALGAAVDSGTPEQQYRLREIVRHIHWESLRGDFLALAARPDNEIDLVQGMWLISRILDPRIDRQPIDRQLDEIAHRVRRKLGEEQDPAGAEPRRVVDAIIHVLKEDFGFAGNRVHYTDPANSSLHRVLATRKGLPILLSHLAIAVGKRLDVPLVGLALPGRYLLRYEGLRGPPQFPQRDIIIDAFGDWQILEMDDVSKLVPGFDPRTPLEASNPRESLLRMMRNLLAHLRDARQYEQASLVDDLCELLASSAPNG